MLECLIMGDSIAVGTKMFAPKECVSYSKGGFNTWQWNKRWGNVKLEANKVVAPTTTSTSTRTKNLTRFVTVFIL
jgi:hypothetical protein